jgi:hypothetical protein
MINSFTHKYLDKPLSILSETCLFGAEGREVNWPAKAWSIVTLVIFQVLTRTNLLKLLLYQGRIIFNYVIIDKELF